MKLMAKTLILWSVNVLVSGAVAKPNTSVAYFLVPPENQLPYMCFDAKEYKKLNQHLIDCLYYRWSHVKFVKDDPDGNAYLSNEQGCCYMWELTYHKEKLIRRVCEVTEPGYTKSVKVWRDDLKNQCSQNLRLTVDDTNCLSVRQSSSSSFCRQFLAENTKNLVLTTTTPSPIGTTIEPSRIEKPSEGSADKLYEIPILLSTLLLICLYI